jgi:hypothetical protein
MIVMYCVSRAVRGNKTPARDCSSKITFCGYLRELDVDGYILKMNLGLRERADWIGMAWSRAR